jgi:uncharacterized integral membrane protein (TIGR00698 family)
MFKALAPGVLLTTFLGIVAYLLSGLHEALDALVLALLGGMVIRLLFGKLSSFDMIIAYAKDIKDFLIPIGVILYAATINLGKSLSLPAHVYVQTFVSVAVLLVVALLLGKAFKLPRKMSWLTAVGSGICGASAIAITCTAVDAKDEDISNSLIAITLVGLVAIVLFRLLPFVAMLGDQVFGVLSGATLQQMGIVKIATSGLEAAKDVALPVKVLRMALIPFVALAFFFVVVKQEGKKKGSTYLLIVLAAFILILGLTAFNPAFAVITKFKWIKIAGTIVFATAFVNLGLLADFKTLKVQPIIVAFLAWVAAVGVFLIMA